MRFELFTAGILLFSLGNYSLATTSVNSILGSIDASTNNSLIVCRALGFESDSSKEILNKLIGGKSFSEYEKLLNLKLVRGTDASFYGLITDEEQQKGPDVDLTFVLMHPSYLFEESSTLLMMQTALDTVPKGNGKKTIILVIVKSSTESATAYALRQEQTLMMLNEAWKAMEKGDVTNDKFKDYISLHIVNTDLQSVDEKAVSTVSAILHAVSEQGVGQPIGTVLSSMLSRSQVLKATKPVIRADQSAVHGASVGLSACLIGLDAATNWAREAATASTIKLNRPDSADEFAGFMESLTGQAEKVLDTTTQSHAAGGLVSKPAYASASQTLHRRIYDMLYQFYRRHIILARQTATKRYNTLIEDLDIDIHTVDRLREAQRDTLRHFSQLVSQLTPRGAPASWDASWEYAQLQRSLDEHIEGRTEQLRAMMVLPYKRNPISVSVHGLALHPFGRDHRQEPLSMMKGEEVTYDSSLVPEETGLLLRPREARPLLVAQEKSDGKRSTRRNAEFAREMLMFPLSMKRPEVPLMGGRSGKRRVLKKALLNDEERPETGPERFIRWDLYPLNEVRESLDEVQEEFIENNPLPMKDKILNAIPALREGFYTHPPINHQNAPGGQKFLPARSRAG